MLTIISTPLIDVKFFECLIPQVQVYLKTVNERLQDLHSGSLNSSEYFAVIVSL